MSRVSMSYVIKELLTYLVIVDCWNYGLINKYSFLVVVDILFLYFYVKYSCLVLFVIVESFLEVP